MKAGIASSASFFSALALAFATAFGKKLPKHELSVLARLSGSGSACRSIDNGYVWWNKDSYAESIAPPEFWNLVDLVLIINPEEKQTGSQDGHKGAITSPYFQSRIKDLAIICDDVKDAFQKKDFTLFGCLVEKEALNFCSILMTQTPPLLYWTDKTVLAMKEVYAMREQGTEVYFTIDAGANLHVICEKKDEEKVKEHFEKQLYVQKIISNYPCQGTRLI